MGISKIGMKLRALIILAALVTAAGELRAAPLNLPIGLPNINSISGVTEYSSTLDILAAASAAIQLNPGGHGIFLGSFNLNVAIDNAGNASGGSLRISGTIAALGFNSGTLLTGTLSDFGFGGAGEQRGQGRRSRQRLQCFGDARLPSAW